MFSSCWIDPAAGPHLRMADNFLSIHVDDTSPAVAYAPFADTFGEPDLSAGWNPYYSVSGYAASLGRLGEGTSTHRTSLDGASLSIQWAGTRQRFSPCEVIPNEVFFRYRNTAFGQCVSGRLQSDR